MPNVTITMPDDVLATGREKAARAYRSLSQHIAFLIEQDSDKKATTRRVSAATDSAGRRATPRKRSRKEAA